MSERTLEDRYLDAMMLYDALGIANTSSYPIESARQSYEYQIAQDNYFKVRQELHNTFEEK